MSRTSCLNSAKSARSEAIVFPILLERDLNDVGACDIKIIEFFVCEFSHINDRAVVSECI
jgi:hypothetical protein